MWSASSLKRRALLRAGVPESVIMKAGGWKTRSMFERYNITNERDQEDAMAALEQYRQRERTIHKN